MTKEQIIIAQEIVERMKKDGFGAIAWQKHAYNRAIDIHDARIAVESLCDLKIVEYYDANKELIRFVMPHGSDFTTFKRYNRNLAIRDFPKNYWFLMLPIGIFIGWFADIWKEALVRKLSKEKQIQQPATPTSSDSFQNHKTDSVP